MTTCIIYLLSILPFGACRLAKEKLTTECTARRSRNQTHVVTPAQAGVQGWIPACAGRTSSGKFGTKFGQDTRIFSPSSYRESCSEALLRDLCALCGTVFVLRLMTRAVLRSFSEDFPRSATWPSNRGLSIPYITRIVNPLPTECLYR